MLIIYNRPKRPKVAHVSVTRKTVKRATKSIRGNTNLFGILDLLMENVGTLLTINNETMIRKKPTMVGLLKTPASK